MDKQEQLKRLVELAGDDGSSKPPKYNVPAIKFNGNDGKFSIRKIDDDGNKEDSELPEKISFTILRKRKLLSSFSPKASYFTNEYSNNQQKISLFKNIEGVVTFEKSDYPTDLRQTYQHLRTREVLYVLYDGEVCKLEVKGGSLAGFYDYLQELSEDNVHSFEVETEITSEKTKNETGFSYYKINFVKSNNEVDLDIIESKLTEINTALKQIDDYFLKKMLERNSRVSSSENDQAEKDFASFGKPEAVIEYPEDENGEVPF